MAGIVSNFTISTAPTAQFRRFRCKITRSGDAKIARATYSARTESAFVRRNAIPHYTSEHYVKRVTGIGGVFFKAKDAPTLRAWYKRHLGVDVQDWGGAAFMWSDDAGNPTGGMTAWCINPETSKQFAPSAASFMINYRVEDVHALAKVLKEEGCNVLDDIQDTEYGKFAWVIDPEGNKVELWEPPAGQ